MNEDYGIGRTQIMTAVIGFLLISIVLGIGLAIGNAKRNEIYAVIDNPYFVGEVVHTESTRIPSLFGGRPSFNVHRVHIAGQFLSTGEDVDEVFYVSRYLYDQLNVGDLINQ